MSRVNEHGQPVGEPVEWRPGVRLAPVTLTGRTCRLEPLHEGHLDALYAALCVDSPPSIWTYMAKGPFLDCEYLAAYLADLQALPAAVPLAILRDRDLSPHRPRQRDGGGRLHHLRFRAAADDRCDGGDVPHGGPRVRRGGCP